MYINTLICSTCDGWTEHVYPNAPWEYWTIECAKCGDGYEVGSDRSYLKRKQGVTTRHIVADDCVGILR